MKFEKIITWIVVVGLSISIGQFLVFILLDALGVIDMGNGLGPGLLMYFGVAITLLLILISFIVNFIFSAIKKTQSKF